MFALTLLGSMLLAQPAAKLPEIKYQEGFFSTKYQLGSQPVKAPDIRLHLEKSNAEAYHLWRKSEGQEDATAILLAVAAGALVGGVLAKDQTIKYAAFGGAGVFACISLYPALASGKNHKKAVQVYNRAAGY